MKFVVIGNGHMPVGTEAERKLATRALNAQANNGGPEVSTVYVGAPGFADESGEVLTCDGRLERASRHFHGEGEHS